MIRIIGKIPHNVIVACSGGIDSMCAVDFLLKGRRRVHVAYFNHDTQHSHQAEKFVKQYCAKNNLILTVGRVRGQRGKRSFEEFWRDERYRFLENFNSKYIITAHHLDDVVETWLMSAIHGNPKLIPYERNKKIYRPFLMTAKKDIQSYADRHGVEYIQDPSNKSLEHMRNYTRHNLMPHVLQINPGIRKTIRKKLVEIYKDV